MKACGKVLAWRMRSQARISHIWRSRSCADGMRSPAMPQGM